MLWLSGTANYMGKIEPGVVNLLARPMGRIRSVAVGLAELRLDIAHSFLGLPANSTPEQRFTKARELLSGLVKEAPDSTFEAGLTAADGYTRVHWHLRPMFADAALTTLRTHPAFGRQLFALRADNMVETHKCSTYYAVVATKASTLGGCKELAEVVCRTAGASLTELLLRDRRSLLVRIEAPSEEELFSCAAALAKGDRRLILKEVQGGAAVRTRPIVYDNGPPQQHRPQREPPDPRRFVVRLTGNLSREVVRLHLAQFGEVVECERVERRNPWGTLHYMWTGAYHLARSASLAAGCAFAHDGAEVYIQRPDEQTPPLSTEEVNARLDAAEQECDAVAAMDREITRQAAQETAWMAQARSAAQAAAAEQAERRQAASTPSAPMASADAAPTPARAVAPVTPTLPCTPTTSSAAIATSRKATPTRAPTTGGRTPPELETPATPTRASRANVANPPGDTTAGARATMRPRAQGNSCPGSPSKRGRDESPHAAEVLRARDRLEALVSQGVQETATMHVDATDATAQAEDPGCRVSQS